MPFNVDLGSIFGILGGPSPMGFKEASRPEIGYLQSASI